jgi:hypothetical protein
MRPSTIRFLGLAFAVLPFACVAMNGGRMDLENGETAGAAGAPHDEQDTATSGGAAMHTTQGSVTGGATANGATNESAGTTAMGGSTTSGSTSAVGSDGPNPQLRYGVSHESPYPCAANTALYYDATPVPSSEVGCMDIHNPSQLYPPNTSRTVVAPTSPGGATCVAYDCWCSAETKLWEPSNSNVCRH